MNPTSARLLLALAAVTTLLGWVLASWLDRMGGLIAIPWLAPATIWLFAATVAYWAWHTRTRLSPDAGERRLDPFVAARTAALALAGSRTGALVAGGYAGIALWLLSELAIAAGRGRLLIAVLACLGGVALVLASLWLEHICRIPDDPHDGADTGSLDRV
ncbi:MAG: DUF3180 domain-containing protein [Candidatus Nanopelagicales bacterium]